MANEIIGRGDRFDQFVYADCDTGNGTGRSSAVVVSLTPSSTEKARITSIHPTIFLGNVSSITAAAELHIIDSAVLFVLESRKTQEDLKALTPLFSAVTSPKHSTFDPYDFTVRYMYVIKGSNMIPLNGLNIMGKLGTNLHVVLNSPNVSGNTSGAAITVTLGLTVFGEMVESNSNIKPVVYQN